MASGIDHDYKQGSWDGEASFEGREFDSEATFEGARFNGPVSFDGAHFRGPVSFANATFTAMASFANVRFERTVSFHGATFAAPASFAAAHFADDIWLGDATFRSDADFGDACFKGGAFGRRPFSVAGVMRLTGVTFEQPVDLVASTDRILCDGLVLEKGGAWDLRWAEIELERVRADGVLLIAFRPDPGPDETELSAYCTGGHVARRREVHPAELERREARSARPRLMSITGTNVEKIALSGLDLRACRFRGGYNLDRLGLEDVRFARSPGWTGRRMLAEEHAWRAQRKHPYANRRWHLSAHRPAPAGIDKGSPKPAQIAPIYRALRKGLEDRKDEPGAADLYYGEMEMRRHAAGDGGPGRQIAAWFERRLVWLYWALCGYALRPLRAATALAVVILISAAGYTHFGFLDLARPFGPPQTAQRVAQAPDRKIPNSLAEFWTSATRNEALTLSIATAAALPPAPDADLTRDGRTVRTLERVIGPILLGLFFVSIRGRVKR
jgi:uncharacterized protein YjbI with pentapeptide repeats